MEDFVEKAEVEVGEKGNSAIIKKSTFLMSASVSPDGSVNQLAQNAIDVLCYLRPATDDLVEMEQYLCCALFRQVAAPGERSGRGAGIICVDEF